MNIIFDRPLFGTTKWLTIEQDGGKIGEMRRWLRPSQQRFPSNARYDVNIEVATHQHTFKLKQQSFSLREGFHWDVTKDDHLVAIMTSAKGLKENIESISTWSNVRRYLLKRHGEEGDYSR